jgi:hypothetical protein
MRRIITWTLVCSVLLLGACASDSDGGSTSAGGSEGTKAETSGRAPGVTDDAVKVGIFLIDAEAVRKVSPDTDYGDWKGAYKALIDDINDRGGINGRKLDATYVVVNPVLPASMETACLKVTQDEQVFVATGTYFGDPLCLLEAHSTAFIGGEAGISEAALARAKAPWFSLSSDDKLARTYEAFDEAGLLDDDFGIFVDKEHEQQVRDVVLPTLKKLGKEPVEVGVSDAARDDQAAIEAQTKVFAEKFKTAGAKTVVLDGFTNGGWIRAMEKNTAYRPVLLQPGGLASAKAFVDQVGLDRSLLAGSFVADAYGPPQRVWEEPEMQKCIAIEEKAGVKVPAPDTLEKGEPTQYGSVFAACQQVGLLKAILTKAGKELNYTTFDNAGTSLGKIHLPGNPESFDYGDGLARGGQAPVTLFKWNAKTEAYEPAS